MSLNYIYGANQGVVNGGELVRISLKLSAFFLFLSCVGKFRYSELILCFPLVYVAIFPIFFVAELDPAYRQAINFSLCIPLFFIKYDNLKLHDLIWFLVVSITSINTFLYLCFSEVRLFENGAFVGAFGNPNSLGIASSLSVLFAFVLKNKIFRSIVIAVNIIFAFQSGSSLSVILCLSAAFLIAKQIAKISILFAGSIILISWTDIVLLIKQFEFIPLAIEHLVKKLNGLFLFLGSFDSVGSHSIDNRVIYFHDGLSRISDTLSFVLGHNSFTEIYFTGDGALIGYLATHGVIVTLMFTLAILFRIFQALNSQCVVRRRAGMLLLLITLSLLSNRLLDYWPIGILFGLMWGISSVKKQTYDGA